MAMTLLMIFVRCIIIYSLVLVLLRLSGKRHVGQMTPLDLVLLLLVSNSVQNAMTGPDTSLLGGIVAACTLFLVNWLLSQFARRFRFFNRWIEGNPTLLVNHGKVIQPNLVHEGIDFDELLQAMREHGISSIEDVRLAVLERDGSISVIKNDDLHPEHTKKPYHRIRYLKHGQ